MSRLQVHSGESRPGNSAEPNIHIKTITKDQFVGVLNDAGISDAQKHRLHAVFEKRHPEEHQTFLEYLGVPADQIARIRAQSRDI